MTALIGLALHAVACRDQENTNQETRNQASQGARAMPNQNQAPKSANANSLPERGDSSPEDFEGTAGVIEKERARVAPALLREVRTARHDRVPGRTPGGHW